MLNKEIIEFIYATLLVHDFLVFEVFMIYLVLKERNKKDEK